MKKKAKEIKKELVVKRLEDLKPHPKNPKDHDIEGIKDSIRHNGSLDPIEIDENDVILAGHGRCQALIELGTEEHEVIQYVGLTEKQKEDYVLRANTTTMSRGFLDEKLKLFDKETLSGAGFTSNDLDRIFSTDEDEEDQFNTQEEYMKIGEPQAKEGEIYILGQHRLMCGDSTKKEDVTQLMDGEKADMVFTDPPYNVDYEGKQGKIKNDKMSEEDFIAFTLTNTN